MLLEFLDANKNTAVLDISCLTLLETLLRQKDCKSNHNFLITKQLEKKKDQRKKRKDVFFLGANGLDFNGFRFPAFRYNNFVKVLNFAKVD